LSQSCLFQCQQSQQQEPLSQKCLCPVCRSAGVCIKCASAKCANCAVSVAPQAIEPITSVSVSTKPTTRALGPHMSVPTVPCRWCLIKCTRDNCASAKNLCAKCAVAVVSMSAKPTTRALEPKMSVPTVPLRWCLYQMCERDECASTKNVCFSINKANHKSA
jgi:hypothetical protein